jgi:hypothetical protein
MNKKAQFNFSLKRHLYIRSFYPTDEHLILKQFIIYGKPSVSYNYFIIISVVLWDRESSESASVLGEEGTNYFKTM